MADLQSSLKDVTDSIDCYTKDDSIEQRQKVLRAIEKLRREAYGARAYVEMMRYLPFQTLSIMIALESGVLDAIVSANGNTVTATELSATTKQDQSLIVRVMRMLTALGICTEGPEVSSSTPSYQANAEAKFLTNPSIRAGYYFYSGPVGTWLQNVVSYMRSNGGKFLQSPDQSKGEKSLAEFTLGHGLWELFGRDAELRENFDKYLSARRVGLVKEWFEIFPVGEQIRSEDSREGLKERVLLVDVGGNLGYDISRFKKRFPDLQGRYVLQDLPYVIEKAKAVVEGEGIECMEYDFFTPQPVKGAQMYYFGGIFHDWNDEKSHTILEHTAAVMAPDSRLLINEFPVADRDANLTTVAYDIVMMANAGGLERSIGQWKALLDSSGLEFVKLWPTDRDSVIEARLR